MPIASSGNVITSPAQMGANVVLTGTIKDGEIVNNDISTTAAIAIGKLSGVAASGANNDITSLGGLTTAIPVNGGGTGATDAAGARTNLGLGNMAEQANNAVNIDGGTINGITDLAVVDGGTGASNGADAATNLGLATQANIDTGLRTMITEAASANLRCSNDANKAGNDLGYVLAKECRNLFFGSVDVYFALNSDPATNTYGKIYVNGVAVGTERSVGNGWANWTETISNLKPGDLIQIYCKVGNATYQWLIANFRIYYDMTQITPATAQTVV